MRAKWQAVLDRMVIRHIDPTCVPVLDLDGDMLKVSVRQARDTRDQSARFEQLNISGVRLRYWPGDRLAAAWLAAAWAGYLMHEALELAHVDGAPVLDPHAAPFTYDRGLRVGLPRELTPETLRASLEVVMSPQAAEDLINAG